MVVVHGGGVDDDGVRANSLIIEVCSAEAAAFCGLVLVFGSKLVSCDAAGLPFGMVSEPRRRLEPTLAGGLVEYLAVKMYFRVSAEFLELCQRALTGCVVNSCPVKIVDFASSFFFWKRVRFPKKSSC